MMDNTQTQPFWKVTATENTTVWDAQNGTVAAKRVHFRYFDGQLDFVDIPTSRYNAQAVLDAIHQKARHHEQVMQLVGPPANMPLPDNAPPVEQILGLPSVGTT